MPRYDEREAREAIAASLSWAEAPRRMGMCSTGNAWRTLKKWTEAWGIPTDHFDPHAAGRAAMRRRGMAAPLEDLLVVDSTYDRKSLKRRLFDEGLKQRVCELCGQDETWRGRPMSLILDHVNGVSTDNRLENLRIVCPNCNATLDTHCGRGAARTVERDCELCGTAFRQRTPRQRFCSRRCGTRASPRPGPRPETRKVERPPYDVLLRETEELGFSATGRRYGVSDNAVRKWLRWYAADAARREEAPGAPP